MKRTILLISMLLAGTLLMAAVQQYTFSFDQPEIVLTDDQAVLIYENCHNLGNEGEPVLPQFNATMLLPQGEELQEVRIISTLYYPEPQNLQLKPAARQFPISVKQPDDYQVIPDKEIYNSSDPYPGKLITAENTHFLSGHSIAGFLICPVEFIPAIKQVRFLQEITVEMISGPSQRANAAQSLLRGDDITVNRVDDLVENSSQRLSYLYQGQQRDEDYDLLLITSSELLPAFQEYLEFKMSTGFTVATETVSNIYASYAGQDDAEKVRNCVIDYYQNHNIDYLILGGDSDGDNPNNVIVPHRGFTALDDPSIPSDMYFSNLDGSWNDDGDDLWGESNEMDLYAEISVGRICVDSAQEIINATNKLMMYQNTPVVADIEKALMIGEELNNSPWTFGGDYKDEIANGSSNNGYTTVAIDPNFNINRLYERDIDWSKYDVFDEFNDYGVNLLNHLGHSNPTYNMKMNNNDLTTTNFTNDGVNRGFVIGYSQGCYNGSFDNWHFSGYYTEDCFAEKFTTIETGEVASIANSRYGWYQPGGTNSSSQYYDRQFYDAIFGQDVTIIGDTNRRSKETDVTYMQYDSYFRWTAYELNLFGDPSMDIWTAEPIDIYTEYPVSIPIGSSTIQFMTDVPFARIALVQNGTLIGRCLTNATGTAVLETFEPIIEVDEIQVSIIAHNRNRHTGSIIVVSDQPYVIYDSYFINDSAGNDNQLPDFSEDILLDVDFYNVGNQPAENLTAVLVCDDEYVTITDQEEDLGNIPPGQIITFEGAFNFVIDDIIPDQHRLDFTLSVTGDERETWNSYFSIFLNAPLLSAGSLEIDDYLGDDNGILDPGETALIMINTINSGHAATPPAIADLTCSNEMITITPVNTELGSIAAEGSVPAIFSVTASAELLVGTPILLDYYVYCNGYEDYNLEHNYVEMIGLIVEDFESGDFSSYDWQFNGNANWFITSGSYQGDYCAQSGNIGSDQSSALVLELDVLIGSEIKFWKKVSSEFNYDFFKFYVDGTSVGQWSGESDWSEETFYLTSGHHILEWIYQKDGYLDEGADCAWLDYISLPVISGLEPAYIVCDYDQINFNLYQGESDSLDFMISNQGQADLFYNILVDYPDVRGTGGPDAFGYIWTDSNALNGPEYDWIDISGIGTQIIFNHNDIGTDLMPIGFEFSFYGIDYSEFRVNPNGWLGFGDDNFAWQNSEIPSDAAPRPAIFPFWDDLYPFIGTNGGGEVYYYSSPEYLVVWFDHVIHYPGDYEGTYDFELVLYPNGNILIQYREMSGDIDTATVGIQNETGDDGLQVVYNQNYLENEMAILLKKVDVWIDLSAVSGTVESGSSDIITLGADTAGLEAGNYLCQLLISSNDPVQQVVSIPVNLHVMTTDTGEFEIPAITSLIGNYPNPFNPETKISFGLKTDSRVVINVYNIKGQKVKNLLDQNMQAGFHDLTWNGRDNNEKQLSSGIYFYRMSTGEYSETRKMMLLK